jgi:hypothetical protein
MQSLISHDVAEVLKALQEYGLDVLYDEKIGELLIPALVTHITIEYGDISMIQGEFELEYHNYSRKLYVYNEKKGEPLVIYFGRKSKAGFHNGYFWILPR